MKLFISALMLLSSLAAFAQGEKPKSQPELKLALNWKAEPQFGGFYAAASHFEQKNLNVKILEGGSGTPTVQMLAAGKVDYAIVSADELVLAHDRGAKDMIAVFATFQTNPQGLMTHAARGFEKIEQILTSEGTLLWQAGLPYAQYMQKKYGPLKVKTAPYLGGIGNFQNDPLLSQQCFVTSEPLAAEKAGLKVKTFLIAATGYNPYTTVLAVRASRLKQNPEEVKKVAQAVRSGWEEYLQNPKATNELMAKINRSMNMETFQKSADVQKPLIQTKGLELGSMSEERWQTLIDQLRELKTIKNQLKARDLFQNL